MVKKESYINRNANLILLFLIVLIGAALVSSAVFFQETLKGINTKYNQRLDDLKKLTGELNEKQELLNKVKEELSLLKYRDESFTEKYSSIKGEKESLEDIRARLEAENNLLKIDLRSSQANLTFTKQLYDDEKDKVIALVFEKRKLDERIASLENKIENLEDEIKSLKAVS